MFIRHGLNSILTQYHSCYNKKSHPLCTIHSSTHLIYSPSRYSDAQSDSIDQAFADSPTNCTPVKTPIKENTTYQQVHSNSIATETRITSTESHEHKTQNDDPMDDYEYSRMMYFNSILPLNGRSNSTKVNKPIFYQNASLHQHKTSKGGVKTNLVEIKKDFTNLWKSQAGCRQIQKALEDFGYECVDGILDKILTEVSEITVHSYGNYVFQKLMAVLNEGDLTKVFKELRTSIADISKKPYGMRSLQAFVAAIKSFPEIIKEFIKELVPNLEELILDQNASHVVQKSLILFDDIYIFPIVETIYKNCLIFSKDMHGCCVVQKSLDNKEIFEGSLKHKIAQIILDNTDNLIIHPYGNYVIQMLISSRQKQIAEGVIMKIKCSIAEFSCDKFASHPVELAYEHATEEAKKLIIDALCHPTNIKRILFDQYGNYVIQKILKCCSKDEKKHILSVYFKFRL